MNIILKIIKSAALKLNPATGLEHQHFIDLLYVIIIIPYYYYIFLLLWCLMKSLNFYWNILNSM